jgi:hypothetical protein
MKIGFQTIQKIQDMISGHIIDYRTEIDNAYQQQDNELTIALSVKLVPGKKGGTDIDVTMNFVKDRVKVKASDNVDETQQPLPFKNLGKGGDTVTVSLHAND